jgi:hypothetical protein
MANYTGKTIAFSHKGGFWKTRYSYTPTCYAVVDNVMISTNKTSLDTSTNSTAFFWEHEVNAKRNVFYETQYKSSLTLVSNQDPSAVKLFKALSLESNSKDWVGTAATNINPAGSPQNELQLGSIKGFVTKEGNQYSELPKSLNNSNSNLDYVCQLDSIIDSSMLTGLDELSADLNNDGVVDVSDILIFLGQFGGLDPLGIADLDLDGTVTTNDLLLLTAQFGTFTSNADSSNLFFDLSQPLLSLVASGWAASVLSSSLNTPLLGGGGSQAVFVSALEDVYTLSYSSNAWNFVNFVSETTVFNVNSPYVYVHSYTSDGNVILGVSGDVTLDAITALISFTNSLGPEWDTIQLYSITSPDINGDPMRGQYLHLHLENDSTTPVETYAINVDFENTKLDGSKGSTQKKPKQKASPSSK